MILRAAVVLIALLVSSGAHANFLPYQTWAAESEVYRRAYIAGSFEALLAFTSDEGKPPRYSHALHYSRCIAAAEMTDGQLAANVLNFAKGKPELHTGSLQAALLAYLIAACGAPPTE
jgi:hypothetical protein